MRKINSKFTAKFISEAGQQLQNKDYFAFVELDRYAIYVIADGLDEAVDQYSAKLAVSNIISNFTDSPNMRKGTLRKLLRKAHQELIDESTDFKLKVSITILVTDYVKIRYAMAGNTRLALYRDGFFKHKSKDQSLTRQLVEEEAIPLDKAMQHEERNNLYCYLGQEGNVSPYVSKKMKLKDGDILLLLTKGVWENVDIQEIGDGLSEAKEAQEVIDNIEELLLSKQPEELDNYTAAAIFVDKTYTDPKRKAKIKKTLAIVLPVLLIVAILSITLFIKYRKRQDKLRTMNETWQSAKEYVQMGNFVRGKEEYKDALTLAKQLKLKDEKDKLDKCFKLCEMVENADATFEQLKLPEAMEAYKEAQKYDLQAGSLGKDYIDNKIDLVKNYMDVNDLIKEADQAKDVKDVDLAIIDYRKAKRSANDLGYTEGKQEAEEKLDALMDSIKDEMAKEQEEKDKKAAEEKDNQAKQEEKQEKEEEKAKEEEKEKAQADEEAKQKADEAAQKKKEDQAAALEYVQTGNAAYETGNYDDAKMYYLMADELFTQLGNTTMTDQLKQKEQLCVKQAVTAKTKKQEADRYVTAANNKYKENELEDAKLLYLMAQDIYSQLGQTEEVTSTNQKIELINQLLTKKNAKNSDTEQTTTESTDTQSMAGTKNSNSNKDNK